MDASCPNGMAVRGARQGSTFVLQANGGLHVSKPEETQDEPLEMVYEVPAIEARVDITAGLSVGSFPT
jgi:hypothetical protein